MDNNDFKDKDGRVCDKWTGRDCDPNSIVFGHWNLGDKLALLQNCPIACGIPCETANKSSNIFLFHYMSSDEN